MALGPNAADPWIDSAGTVHYPVNIIDQYNASSTWTLTNCTYSNGLLTSSNTTNSAVQTVTLSAGTYALVGAYGMTDTGHAVKLVVSGATDGSVLSEVLGGLPAGGSATLGSQASANYFTLTAASQDVTFTLDIVTTAAGNAGAVGSASMNFYLEASTANQYPVTGQQ
jgi:hypothetical protein